MTEFNPAMDQAFRECADLQLRHHYLLLDNKDDSEEMIAVEARLEELWPSFDEIQRRSLSGMGSDLNWIRRNCEPPPRGRKTPDEVSSAERHELEAAMKSKEWHRILHFLRLCAPWFQASSLASERRIAYDAIGLPRYSSAFAQVVGYAFRTFTKEYLQERGTSFLFLQEVPIPTADLGQIGQGGRRRQVVTRVSVMAGNPVRV